MSGFAGIVSPDGRMPDATLLQKMAARLAFRGPDATHIWTRPGAGFCFTFLRTGPAPQATTQPCSLDGNVWLLGDVRLDGRDDLRRELEQLGESSEDSATDEELILRAWRLWGEEGLPKLLGDFSFALWDSSARELRCMRDLIGARPFYYASPGGWLCFSNTLEAVRLFPGVSSALDPQFIGDFLINESSLDAWRTVYKDIRRLAPGYSLKYGAKGVSVSRGAEFAIEEPLWFKRPEEYIERFRILLEQAVADRLPHAPSAIFLSGGLDSTSVAAVAAKVAKNHGTPGISRAYTVDCQQLFDDRESTLASRIAEDLGLGIEVSSCASCLPFAGSGDQELRTPEPVHDPFWSLINGQFRRISTHARVLFTGYGGDDILTGQAWPYFVYLLRLRRFGEIGRTFGDYLLKHKRIPPLRGGFRTRLRRWLGRTNPLTGLPPWIEPDLVREYHLSERSVLLQEPAKSIHPLHPIAHSSLSGEHSANMYELEDASWTRVPVESRSPLLDLRISRFLLRVPPVPWCMEKEMLRQAMTGMLPDEIRLRPKTAVPVDPVYAFVESNRWSPRMLLGLVEEPSIFVDRQRLSATLQSATGSTLAVALRPISLLYWLKGVEK